MICHSALRGGGPEAHENRMRSQTDSSKLLPPRATRLLLAASIASLFAPLAGCELVLGMSGHEATESPAETGGQDSTTDTNVDAPVDTGPSVCTLPSTGDASARVTNVFPALGRLDVCFKPDSGSTIGPIFATASGCGGGLVYKDSSAAFKIPSGSYEIDVIRGGGKCSDPPLASVSHVTFETGTTTNAIVMGNGATDFTVKALKEGNPTTIASKVRFVHAIGGAPNQDFGLGAKSSLPANIATLFFSNVAYGTTAAPGSGAAGTIDSNGYVDFNGNGAVLYFGRAPAGTTALVDLIGAKLVSTVGYTVYAIGKSDSAGKGNDVKFPLELLLCNERDTDGVLARCANAIPLDVTFDVVNTQLNGAWAAYESPRRPAIPAAIAGLNGDVACITEVWSEADKTAIIDGTKSKYPYSARFAATNATPIDDAKDQGGKVPVYPTTASCTSDPIDPTNPSAGTQKQALEDLLACIRDNCAVTKGSGASWIQDLPSTCISDNCLAETIAATSAPRCWDCALAHMFGRATFDATKTACETDPSARYAFDGTNGVVLLSRFPFDPSGAPEIVNLGATDFRVALIRAPIVVQDSPKTVVDAYCTVLTTPASGVTRPYVGPYGGDGRTCTKDSDCKTASPDFEKCSPSWGICVGAAEQQWKNELLLQVGKVADLVAAKSGAIRRRAVVMGDWYTGPQVGTLTALNVESFNALTARLPLASAEGYAPTCTFCADNPIQTPPGTTPTGTSTWSSYSVLGNIPVTDVRSNAVTLKTPSVTAAGLAYKIPVSSYYGFRTVVRIRP